MRQYGHLIFQCGSGLSQWHRFIAVETHRMHTTWAQHGVISGTRVHPCGCISDVHGIRKWYNAKRLIMRTCEHISFSIVSRRAHTAVHRGHHMQIHMAPRGATALVAPSKLRVALGRYLLQLVDTADEPIGPLVARDPCRYSHHLHTRAAACACYCRQPPRNSRDHSPETFYDARSARQNRYTHKAAV